MFKSFTTRFNNNNSSQSSFAPLNPSSSKQSDERVPGELMSTCGLNGGVPSIHSQSSSPSTKSSRSESRLSSHTISSTTTSSMVLPPSSTMNYEQGYGDLVSLYGFGGGVPCLPPTQKTKSKPKSSVKNATPTLPSSAPKPASTPKDYEQAYGQLASSYGFGGPVPSLPKPKKQGNSVQRFE